MTNNWELLLKKIFFVIIFCIINNNMVFSKDKIENTLPFSNSIISNDLLRYGPEWIKIFRTNNCFLTISKVDKLLVDLSLYKIVQTNEYQRIFQRVTQDGEINFIKPKFHYSHHQLYFSFLAKFNSGRDAWPQSYNYFLYKIEKNNAKKIFSINEIVGDQMTNIHLTISNFPNYNKYIYGTPEDEGFIKKFQFK
jgi:hypothetical protein